jgi:hypothetical protein
MCYGKQHGVASWLLATVVQLVDVVSACVVAEWLLLV